MRVNVNNMPINKLYKFDDNRFVWSIMLYETRNGNYPQEKTSKYTEVYCINSNGLMEREASGRLLNNPNVDDYDKFFSIFDYDKDLTLSFPVSMPLQEAGLEDLYKMRDLMTRSYQNRNKK